MAVRKEFSQALELTRKILVPEGKPRVGSVRHDDGVRLGDIDRSDLDPFLRNLRESLRQRHGGLKPLTLQFLAGSGPGEIDSGQDGEVQEFVREPVGLHQHPVPVAEQALPRNKGLC